MFSETSIFSTAELTLAAQLAKDISWLIKQQERLGPFLTEDGKWHVANGICNICGGLVDGIVYDEQNLAAQAVEDTIKKMAQDDPELLRQYGPTGGLCDNCKEKFRYAKNLEKQHCSVCGRDCSGCSIYHDLEDLFK